MKSVDVTRGVQEEARGWNLECTPSTLALDAYKFTGVLVVRGLIERSTAEAIAEDWKSVAWNDVGKRRLDYNPVNSVVLPESFVTFTRSSIFVHLLAPLFGSPTGLFNRRIVAKDDSYSGDVFLHQDSCYQRGTLNKVSVFVAFSDVSENSGGLEFWLGTHRFGYLGDAGEIDGSLLPSPWPTVSPILSAGDAVIMNSSCWHRSGPNVSGEPRILGDIHYQSADDASSREVIWPDKWNPQSSVVLSDSPTMLSRGRISTIQDLSAKLSQFEMK